MIIYIIFLMFIFIMVFVGVIFVQTSLEELEPTPIPKPLPIPTPPKPKPPEPKPPEPEPKPPEPEPKPPEPEPKPPEPEPKPPEPEPKPPEPEPEPTPNPAGFYGYNYPAHVLTSASTVRQYVTSLCENGSKLRYNDPIFSIDRCLRYYTCEYSTASNKYSDYLRCLDDTYFSFSLQKCVQYKMSDCGLNIY
nr:unknown [Pieris rapae granulovirus]